MPLIKCYECGEAVSDRARTCPKCGAPVLATIKRNQKRALNNFGVGLIFIVIVVFFAWKFMHRLQNDSFAPLKSQEQNQTAPR